MELLPQEITTEIFEYLPIEERLKFERVSRQFQETSRGFNLAYLKNFIQFLPDDTIEEIFERLSLKDVHNFVISSESMKRRFWPLYIKRYNEEYTKVRIAVENSGITGRFDLLTGNFALVLPGSRNRGRSCKSFTRDDLLNILHRLGITPDSNMTKPQLCHLIMETLARFGKLIS